MGGRLQKKNNHKKLLTSFNGELRKKMDRREYMRQYMREHHEEYRGDVVCEVCKILVRKNNMARHKRSKRHLESVQGVGHTMFCDVCH